MAKHIGAEPTIAATLAAAADLAPDGRGRLHAPVALSSWPGIVHGGGLVALFDAAAVALGEIAAPRILEGRLTSSRGRRRDPADRAPGRSDARVRCHPRARSR